MEQFTAMLVFAGTLSFSPGPVNLVIFTSSSQNGARQTMPFVFGATLGFTSLLLLIALLVAQLLPVINRILPWLTLFGCSYFLYIGVKIWQWSGQLVSSYQTKTGFVQGVTMQWLNPKAWMACLSGITAFELAGSIKNIAIFSSIYLLVCLTALTIWAWIGQLAKHQLTSQAMTLINRLLALALIALGLSMLLQAYKL